MFLPVGTRVREIGKRYEAGQAAIVVRFTDHSAVGTHRRTPAALHQIRSLQVECGFRGDVLAVAEVGGLRWLPVRLDDKTQSAAGATGPVLTAIL